MKTKMVSLFTCMILICLLVTSKAVAQEAINVASAKTNPEEIINRPASANYTYKLFVAPNKVYGYDIFQDGRIVFHQPALAEPAGNKNAALKKSEQADKAAMFAISKIKKGLPAELTREELSKIIAAPTQK